MKYFPLILIGLLFLYSCDHADTAEEIDDPKNIDLNGNPASIGPMIEAFGFEAFQNVVQSDAENENLCISPLSISTALAMTWNGSEGETSSAMADVLHFGDEPIADIDAGFDKLVSDLQPNAENVEYKQANGILWDKNRMEVYEPFLNAMDYGFNAEKREMDFTNVATKEIINAWAEENTDGKIKDLIDEIRPHEVMFLINALFYKGDWDIPLIEHATSPHAFKKYDGTIVSVSMMFNDEECRSFKGANYEAVDLLFKGEDYAMTFILPAQENEQGAFLNTFDEAIYHDLIDNKMRTERIHLRLPKFSIDYKIEMKKVLSDIGMGVAFSSQNADFSNLGQSSIGRLFIERVIHKVQLEVDEYGVEGAAATAVGVGTTSIPPSITFDRPFYFVLRHVESQAVLFIGLVSNPL